MTLEEAVVAGRLEGLRELRVVLAREISSGPQGEKAVSQTAALSRQLRDTLREIAELERAQSKGSLADDLASRRKARSGGTESDAAAGGSGQE